MPMTGSTQVVKRTYPWTDTFDGLRTTFRLMTRDDRDAVVAFATQQPESDRVFLRINITDPAVVDEWLDNIERGRTVTVFAESEHGLIGYASLHHNEMLWTSHMAEIRVLVDHATRGKGIAHRLVGELLHIARAMRLERLICQVPADQDRVRHMFESLGFQPEAILPDWIRTPDGALRDLMILSMYLRPFGA